MRQHDQMDKESKQRMGELKVQLISIVPFLKDSVPKTMARYLTPERIMRLVMTSAANPKSGILQCNLGSVATSLISAVSLGLEPNGPLGHCYLVPYEHKTLGFVAQLIIGYRGYIELAYRSNKIKSIEGYTAHAQDIFKVRLGSHSEITHVPELIEPRGEVRAAYICTKFVNGGTHIDFMTTAEIKQNKGFRDANRRRYPGPWKTDFTEMAKKTVLRRAFKWFPANIEMSEGMALDSDGIEPADDPMVYTVPGQQPLDIAPKGERVDDNEATQLPAADNAASTRTREHVDAMAKKMQRQG